MAELSAFDVVAHKAEQLSAGTRERRGRLSA
jgi:hypothetical protein